MHHEKKHALGDSATVAVWHRRSHCWELIRLSANFFSGPLSSQSLLHAPLLARFQIVGVTLDFPNDIFRLNLALEPTQGILQRFAVLQSNFCQTDHPQTRIN